MNGLATIVVHNAVAALLLAAVIWPVGCVIRRPALVHVLWLLVLLRLIAPPLVGFEYASLLDDTIEPAAPISGIETSAGAVESNARRLADWIKPGSATERLESRPVTVTPATVQSPMFSARTVSQWLAGTALGVTVVLTLIAALRIMRFRRLLAQLEPGSAGLAALVEQVAATLGLVRLPDVRVGMPAGAPFVWNLGRRPTVVVPSSFVTALSDGQLAMILTHELAHLRRRDHWVRVVELIVTLTCWWNPLVYWVRRRMHVAEEQACDAWVAWAFPAEMGRYAELLLRASQLAVPRSAGSAGLVSPLFRVHPLKARIAMIVQGRTPHRNSRLTALVLAAVALVALPSYVRLTAADDDKQAAQSTAVTSPTVDSATPAADSTETGTPTPEPDYPAQLQIKVLTIDERTTADGRTEKVTEPVEGATIGAFLGVFDEDGNAMTVSGVTGPNGLSTIPVPYGSFQMFPAMLPAGYWLDFSEDNESQFLTMTTSQAASVFEGTFIARRGKIWNVRARDTETGERVGLLQCDVSPTSGHLLDRSGPTVLNAAGAGQFTLPGPGKNYSIRLFGPSGDWHTPPRYAALDLVELSMDVRFDPTTAVEVRPGERANECKVIDEEGREALLRNASAVIEDGRLWIDVKVGRIKPPTEIGRGIGLVVNPDGQPVAGARLTTMHVTADGTQAWSGIPVRSDRQGKFTFEHLSLGAVPGLENSRILVMAAGNGFSPAYSKSIDHPKVAGETIDFGRITVSPGYSVRVRVLDLLGGPAAGAIVMPGYDQRPTRQNTTDTNGEVVLHNLPAGKVQIFARIDEDQAAAEVTVPDDGRVVTATLRMEPELELVAGSRFAGTVPHPRPAPPLEVAAWTDGNARSIQDFKGRVVALYFWDRKTDGCAEEFAIIDNLRQKFADDGVVFLGVHPGGSTVEEVAAFMAQHDWKVPTGIAVANDAGQSQAIDAYGVSTPSFVVITRDGNIYFNRDEIMHDERAERLHEEAARALKIKWPIEETSSEDEGCDACAQILEYIEARAIRNALGPVPQ